MINHRGIKKMVIIANPIYDVVFKYMMANLEIARGVLTTIIDEEIVHLDFKAQEHVHKFRKPDSKELDPEINPKGLTYFHLDFIAKIKMKTGGYKNVLIELQKTNIPHDMMRFRRYVGEQYKKEDEVVQDDGSVISKPLPIITIYILGYRISQTLPGVIKVNRHYIDVLGGGKEIEEHNDFIECLSHNSYVIQIPSLHVELKNDLECVLSVFQQENFVDELGHLKRYEHDPSGGLLAMILKQLQKAAGDGELHKQIEDEEAALHEFNATFQALIKQVAQINKELDKKDEEIKKIGSEMEKKDKEMEKKDKYIQELLKKLETKSTN